MSKINIVMGLHPTPKSLHPYSHARSGIGVMFSTKLFEPISAIVDLLNRRGEELAIKSIVEVYDGKHSELTANLYGTQKVMIILKNNNLINNIGGSQIVKSYVEHSEKVNNAIDNINLLIINLRTSKTKEEIYDHLNKNISDIEYIKTF
jgi:3-polyprenyl-4-hydroxybenzoate decarboxylase